MSSDSAAAYFDIPPLYRPRSPQESNIDRSRMRNSGRGTQPPPAGRRPNHQQKAFIREQGPLLPPVGARHPFHRPQRPFIRRPVRDNDNPEDIPAEREDQEAAIEVVPRRGHLRLGFYVKFGILFMTFITTMFLLCFHLLYASCQLPFVFAWAYFSLAVNASLLSRRLRRMCAVRTIQLITGIFTVLFMTLWSAMVIVDTKLGNSDTLRIPSLSCLAGMPESDRFCLASVALIHALLCLSLVCLTPLFEMMQR